MQLLCGASKRCITPDRSELGVMRGLKNKAFAGVIDDINVRVTAIGTERDRVLLAAFEMTQPPATREFLAQLSRETQTPVENIFFFSTHTHSVPLNTIDMEEPERQSRETLAAAAHFTELLHERTMEAALEAVESMRPARMGYARDKSWVNVVRFQEYAYLDGDGRPFPVCNLGCDPSAAADRSLFALRVEDMAGRPIAFLVNYPMHLVTTIWNDFDGAGAMGVSGDAGGAVCRFIEAENPGSVAIWSSAAAGDLNPVMLNETILPDPVTGRTCETVPKGPETALSSLKVISQRHYADIKRALRGISCAESDVDVAAAEEWSVTPGCGCIRHKDAPPEFITGEGVPEHTVRLHMARVGSLTLCGVGAELFSSLGRAMLESAPAGTVLITHDSSTICSSHYILDDETLARCDASRGFSMVPGYDEYRCQAGIMRGDLCGHVRSMAEKLKNA